MSQAHHIWVKELKLFKSDLPKSCFTQILSRQDWRIYTWWRFYA